MKFFKFGDDGVCCIESGGFVGFWCVGGDIGEDYVCVFD